MKKPLPLIAKPISFRVRFAGKNAKIVLRNGESVVLTDCKQTDEGFSAKSFLYYRDGNDLFCEQTYNAHDCDGPITEYRDYTCPVAKRFDVRGKPDWRLIDQRLRDYYAEAMGY